MANGRKNPQPASALMPEDTARFYERKTEGELVAVPDPTNREMWYLAYQDELDEHSLDEAAIS